MTTDQRKVHVKRFRSYFLKPTDFYQKPISVSKKPGDKGTRKRLHTEATFVEERVAKVTVKRKNQSFTATATVAIDLKKLIPRQVIKNQ